MEENLSIQNNKNNINVKLLVAIVVVIISLVLGAYTKFMFFFHLSAYFDWLNFILYIVSWIILFVAAFFVGKEVVSFADQWVKKKMHDTYDITVALPKKGIEKGVEATKKLHKATMKHSKKIRKATVNHGKELKKVIIDDRKL